MKLLMTLAAATMTMPLAAFAHDGVAIKDAYARAANPKAGAAFMVIENHRDTVCTLIGASGDVAEKIELHTHTEVDGVMKMGRIEGGIEIAPHASHALERGGDHVMLMGLSAPLEEGKTFELSLDFGDCGVEKIEIPVDNAREAAHDTAPAKHNH